MFLAKTVFPEFTVTIKFRLLIKYKTYLVFLSRPESIEYLAAYISI
jgi:hypothetical protein